MPRHPADEDFLRQFSSLWHGGYFEGDPRDPHGENTYGEYGYNSAIFTTYMACIRPYVDANTTALEIGPGRGAWSKVILGCGAKHLYALDAASAEHTGFWQYVGSADRATYILAKDFSLDGVPDNSIDYFFSFGVFCHLKPEMSAAYIGSLARKMKSGANGFLQFGDFDKYNHCLKDPSSYVLLRALKGKRRLLARLAYSILLKRRMNFTPLSKDAKSNLADPEGRGSWYHWSTHDACATIKACGFEIVEPDINVLSRDPVVHFRVGSATKRA